MLVPVLAFCAGAASLPLLPALPSRAMLVAALVAALACRRRAPAIAAGCCGLLCASLSITALLARDWPCTRDRETLALDGVVAAPAVPRDGRVDFELDATSPRRLRIRLAWYDAPLVPAPGQRWSLRARLRCRHGLVNPGTPDHELALLRQGISASGYVLATPAPVLLAPAGRTRPIERLRRRVADAIAQAVPDGPSAAVLQGLSVGVRASIAPALWDAFAATGLAHLMAISGTHVTGCAIAALLLLRILRRLPGVRRVPRWAAIESACVIGLTAAYALLSGASAPALRTLAMVAAAAALRLSRRHWQPHEALAIAALCLIGTDPLCITSAGFWLSFVATATLFAAAGEPGGWPRRARAFASAQAALLATLAPVLAGAFGRISLMAPFANALAIPFFSLLLLPLVLLGTALELARAQAAMPVWRALASLLDPLWPILLAAARSPIADWAPARQSGWLLAAAGLTVFIALWLPLAGTRAAAAAMLVAVVAGSPARPPGDGWSLTVVDVGQGLAAVVETRSRVLIFDAGPRWRGGGTAAAVSLLPYLRARGIRRVDRLIISHPDQDHAGGVETLTAAFEVAASPACRRGERWRWDGVQFEVLHPPAGLQASDNDASCALLVAGPGGRALLLADQQTRAESLLAQLPITAEVVLLPHHGSRSSSTTGLVSGVRARLGIVSAGFGNRWGMPHAEVTGRWRAAGTTVLNTAVAGAVSVRFDRRGMEVTTARDAPHWWRPAPAA